MISCGPPLIRTIGLISNGRPSSAIGPFSCERTIPSSTFLSTALAGLMRPLTKPVADSTQHVVLWCVGVSESICVLGMCLETLM